MVPYGLLGFCIITYLLVLSNKLTSSLWYSTPICFIARRRISEKVDLRIDGIIQENFSGWDTVQYSTWYIFLQEITCYGVLLLFPVLLAKGEARLMARKSLPIQESSHYAQSRINNGNVTHLLLKSIIIFSRRMVRTVLEACTHSKPG